MRKLPREDDVGILTGLQGACERTCGNLDCSDRQLGLEDERVGAAVGNREVGVELLDSRLCQPVVESRLELGLDRHFALLAANVADQTVIRVPLLLTVVEAIGED